MSLSYNLTGTGRKALVQAISEILGKPAVYQGAPTFAYAIDCYNVDKNGTLTYPEGTDPEKVRSLVASLFERGYQPAAYTGPAAPCARSISPTLPEESPTVP